MRTSGYRRAVGLTALAAWLSAWATAGSGAGYDDKTGMYKSVLPDDVFARLVTDDAQIVKESLAKASDAKMAVKAKDAALMIAVYAQGAMQKSGGNAAAMVGLRDSALKVVKAIKEGKTADALKLADDLKPAGKADPTAKTTAVPIHQNIEIDDLMQQFKPDRSGGLGMETKLQTLAKKRNFTEAEYQQKVPMLYRIATIAQPTEGLVPAPMGKKTPDKWVKFTQDMGTLSVQAAELAKKPRPEASAVSAALKKLDDNCASCHTVFRDD